MAFTFDGIQDVWTPIIDEKTESDFLVIGFADGGKSRKALEVRASGEGGRAALYKEFESNQNQVLFSVLRVAAVDEKNGLVSKRVKFMFIKFIGTDVTGLAKARASGASGDVKNFLGGAVQFTVDVSGDSMDEDFSVVALGRKMISAGGAHKPVRYDFGGGESVNVDALDSEGLN